MALNLPPRNAGPLTMGVLCRVITSRGLSVVGSIGGHGGWYWAKVKDRATGEDKGMRWMRRRDDGSWDVRKEAP